MDWRAWHEDYESPDSALTRRLAVVQALIRAALDRAPPGPVQAIGVCAGQGHDLIGVLAECFPEDPLTIPHRVWAVTTQAPPS